MRGVMANAFAGTCCTRSSRLELGSRSNMASERALVVEPGLCGEKDELGDGMFSWLERVPLQPAGTLAEAAGSWEEVPAVLPSAKDTFHRDRPRSTAELGRLNKQSPLSWATFLITLLIFLFETAAYNWIFLWRILPARGKEERATQLSVLFNFFWCMAFWSYCQAHRADPGTVPRSWQEFAVSMGGALPVAPPRMAWQPGKATWCRRCCFPRPERAHHCLVCGKCVLRMDHHCPFIFNCVGFNNHKFFLLLVVYGNITCIIALLTTLPDLWYYAFLIGYQEEETQLQSAEVLSFLVAGLLAMIFLTVLAPMAPIHLILAARNQTSIEGNYKNMPNPFNQGDIIRNFSQILGSFGPDWLIPIMPLQPLGDGVSFDRPLEGGVSAELTSEFSGRLDEDAEKQVEQLWRQRYGVHRHRDLGEEDGYAFERSGLMAGALNQFWRSFHPAA